MATSPLPFLPATASSAAICEKRLMAEDSGIDNAPSIVNCRRMMPRSPTAYLRDRNWKKDNKIGSGTYGDVYRNSVGAIKVVRDVSSAICEISRMVITKNPYIMTMLKFNYLVELNEYHIIMPLCQASLWDVIKRNVYKSENAVDYARQILQALEHIHNMGIVHGDVKLSNVLVTSHNTILLTDFGISKLAGNDVTTQYHTAMYRSPEILHMDNMTVFAHTSSDIWAFGRLYCELLGGRYIYPMLDCNDNVYHACEFFGFPVVLDSRKYFERDFYMQVLRENDPYDKFLEPRTRCATPVRDSYRVPVVSACMRFNPADRVTATQALAMLGIAPEETKTPPPQETTPINANFAGISAPINTKKIASIVYKYAMEYSTTLAARQATSGYYRGTPSYGIDLPTVICACVYIAEAIISRDVDNVTHTGIRDRVEAAAALMFSRMAVSHMMREIIEINKQC